MPQTFVAPSNRIGRRVLFTGAVAMALLLTGWPLPAQVHPGLPHAQRHESRREIDQLEDQWRDAVLKGDTKSVESLLADDYMAIGPAGTLQTRDQALESLRSGRLHFTSLTLSDRKVRFYGTTAIVTSLAQVQASSPEGNIAGCYRYTRVYARNTRGDWKVVSFEASPIRSPSDRKDKDEYKDERSKDEHK